ncbi:hypothetical protein DFP73DRAFT_285051 [Morchella snyderi]|nr:hypothetical protein DFP73DRAFT_285051 [Morchella snyderi]
MGGLSDTDIGLPGELEKQEIRSEVFPVMATQEQITQWQKEILPRLERILEKHLPAEESVSIDLLGIGTSRDKSRPTIVVTCKSSRSVKLHLKRFPYDRTVFGLKVRKGSVQRSSGGSGRIAAQYSRHQEKPLPGASIGACLDGNPLPAATYGGLILVDNKPYGLTVHHLVDPDEQTDGGGTDVEEGQLTSARGPHRHGEIVNRCLYSESEASTSDVEFEPDDEQGSMWGSLVGEADDEIFNDTEIQDISEPNGDIPGLGMNHNKRIVVVQPAAMDLLDQERSECESVTKDYYLGTILASSGIKRVIFESEKHEIDWALIEISSDRLGQRNLIQGGGRFLISHTYTYDEDSEPCYYVSTNEFSNLAVHGIGRTSGLKEGRISGAISAIRIHGRKTFSRSWGVTGEIGVGGDSGAWVIDNRRGGVCGHIIASKNDDDDKVKIAYIIPMELLLRDIKKTLQAESVCLPTAAVAAQIGYMVESRLTECEGSSAADIRPINPTLSTGGSDDVSSLASLPSS